MDNMIGKLLDNRYELLEIIGTGGMALVYKAHDHRLNRSVAVKILKSDLAEDEDFRRRFRDESQAVAMLSHPNIVSVYDVSRGEIEYIVMELIDGITLKQYMDRRGKLNWRESLHFITQIMRGLSHAHSRGIIHRDIKPQNVMILRDGSVKIADFGIARLESSKRHTMTQQALGSVHYISPEQAKGDVTDARSDIYSAGVVLYEMLTSRLPFEGDSAVSVAIQHLSSVPLTPCEIDPTVPLALEKICMKAMACDIDKRYPTAEAMIADLEEFRKNPNTDLQFTIDEFKKPKSKTSKAPTQPLPKLGGADFVSGGKQSEEIEPDDEGDIDDGPKSATLPKALIIVAILALCGAAVFGLWQLVINSFNNNEPVKTDYEVPNLVGMTIEQANADERVNGIFTITQIGQRASKDYPAGQIIEQSPSWGKTVRENREINVFVSTGIKTGTMPNVVNQEHRAAAVMLRQLDLNLTVDDATEEYSDDISPGYVISSNPAEGATLQDGDVVMLVISKGPKVVTVNVITLTNMSLELAQKNISELGLVCAVDYAYSETVAADYVISQSVPANTKLAQGSTIKIVVSLGPEQQMEDPEPLPPDAPSDGGEGTVTDGGSEGGAEGEAP
ncbi:MAG: Stk1 family PASTA domain-containing Ser/Thr kinase [Oscillospiraceae bacterium]|nr:Stk1 family PASTA domain-containing Ser/Thr kinase [Oscillospiraceae bacterium]